MAKKVKKVRKNVVRGIAHVKATQNNTLVTITDANGETVCWDSAGTIGFKGARKSTPFAATRAGESAAQKARKIGMSEVEIRIKGSGCGSPRSRTTRRSRTTAAARPSAGESKELPGRGVIPRVLRLWVRSRTEEGRPLSRARLPRYPETVVGSPVLLNVRSIHAHPLARS
jgi:small subunit ribosomal protein S11